jgi:hypothetical protein
MKPLVIPTVNLNGNDAASLVEDCSRIIRALREAEAIIACGHDLWHGRNHLPSRVDGERKNADARDAVNERRDALNRMAAEFEDLGLAIQRQGR